MRVASPLVFVEVDLPVAAQLLARQRLAGGAHGDRPGALRVAVERRLRQAVPLHENRQSVIEGLIPGELVQRRRPVRFDRRAGVRGVMHHVGVGPVVVALAHCELGRFCQRLVLEFQDDIRFIPLLSRNPTSDVRPEALERCIDLLEGMRDSC